MQSKGIAIIAWLGTYLIECLHSVSQLTKDLTDIGAFIVMAAAVAQVMQKFRKYANKKRRQREVARGDISSK